MIQFRTAEIKENGMLTFNAYNVACTYLKGWFWVDLISTIPWDLLSTIAESQGLIGGSSGGKNASHALRIPKLLRLLRLAKLLKVVRAARIFKRWEKFIVMNVRYAWRVRGRGLFVLERRKRRSVWLGRQAGGRAAGWR